LALLTSGPIRRSLRRPHRIAHGTVRSFAAPRSRRRASASVGPPVIGACSSTPWEGGRRAQATSTLAHASSQLGSGVGSTAASGAHDVCAPLAGAPISVLTGTPPASRWRRAPALPKRRSGRPSQPRCSRRGCGTRSSPSAAALGRVRRGTPCNRRGA